MAMCEDPHCTEHYGCRLRSKGLQLSPRATMTRTQNWRPTRSVPPAGSHGYVYDERPDGSKMPILNADGSQLHKRDYSEKKHQIDSTIRRIRNSGASQKD